MKPTRLVLVRGTFYWTRRRDSELQRLSDEQLRREHIAIQHER